MSRLFQQLADARENPQKANISWLLNFLDLATFNLDLENQLKINGKALEAVAKIWGQKSLISLEEWLSIDEDSEEIVAIAEDVLQGLGLLQKSVSVDLTDLIIEPEKETESGFDFNSKLIINSIFSSINTDEKAEVLLDYDENIDCWISLLDKSFEQENINFTDLVRVTNLSPARVLLAVLHGEFDCCQTNFYDCNSLLISRF